MCATRRAIGKNTLLLLLLLTLFEGSRCRTIVDDVDEDKNLSLFLSPDRSFTACNNGVASGVFFRYSQCKAALRSLLLFSSSSTFFAASSIAFANNTVNCGRNASYKDLLASLLCKIVLFSPALLFSASSTSKPLPSSTNIVPTSPPPLPLLLLILPWCSAVQYTKIGRCSSS